MGGDLGVMGGITGVGDHRAGNMSGTADSLAARPLMVTEPLMVRGPLIVTAPFLPVVPGLRRLPGQAGRQDGSVGFLRVCCDAFPGVAGACPACSGAAHVGPELRVAEQFCESSARASGWRGGDVQAGFLVDHRLPQSADGGCHDRHAASHGLQRDNPERLVPRAQTTRPRSGRCRAWRREGLARA